MNKLMRKVVVLMVAFSMLFAGAFASGSTEVQAATTPAKVTIKSAKANYWHDEIFVSWKSVKNATGYQVAFRKTNSSVYRKVSVRGKTSRTLLLDTYRTSVHHKSQSVQTGQGKRKSKNLLWQMVKYKGCKTEIYTTKEQHKFRQFWKFRKWKWFTGIDWNRFWK